MSEYRKLDQLVVTPGQTVIAENGVAVLVKSVRRLPPPRIGTNSVIGERLESITLKRTGQIEAVFGIQAVKIR